MPSPGTRSRCPRSTWWSSTRSSRTRSRRSSKQTAIILNQSFVHKFWNSFCIINMFGKWIYNCFISGTKKVNFVTLLMADPVCIYLIQKNQLFIFHGLKMANILNLWLHVATSCLLMLLHNKKCQLKLKFWDIKLKSCLCTLQSIAYTLLNSQREIVHIFTLLLWAGLCWIVSQRKSSFCQGKWLFFNIWLGTFCSPHT